MRTHTNPVTGEVTEVCSVIDLKEGDIVLAHGGRFQVFDPHWYDGGYGQACNWGSKVLELGPAIPASWASGPRGWHIQGNSRAKVARVVR